MSKWPEIRDSLEEALKLEETGKDLKNRFVDWLTEEGIDFIQPLVDSIIAESKADAPNEKGWCKIRDAVLIPVSLNIGMSILKLVLEKAAEEVKS